jgi:flagellar transcriptional activator FlhC
MLKTFHQYSLALELLRRHARISIIHRETGLPRPLLRKTYRELHGRSPRPGALKYSTQGLTRNIKQYKEVTLFAVCFQAVASNSSECYIRKIVIAFDAYKKSLPSSKLDFTAAWVIARDLMERQIELVRCSQCGASVLIKAREDLVDRCCVCKFKLKMSSS